MEQRALFDKLPVDVEFSKCNATGTTDVVAPSADVVKAAVFYADVADVTVVIQADDEYAKFTFLQVIFLDVRYVQWDERKCGLIRRESVRTLNFSVCQSACVWLILDF